MCAQIANREPKTFQAGDTMRFDKTLADYPPSAGWSLTYRLVSPTLSPQYFTIAGGGSFFSVNVPPATTALWASGTYLMTGQVSNGTDRYTIYQDELAVTPNTNTTTTLDYRSYAERMLALVEATISGSITRRDISYSVNGRSFVAKTDDQLFKARDYFKSCMLAEKSPGQNAKILTRFTKP